MATERKALRQVNAILFPISVPNGEGIGAKARIRQSVLANRNRSEMTLWHLITLRFLNEGL